MSEENINNRNKENSNSRIDLSLLNEQQREAVECIDGPLLILAGAGSGKTRVLTYRIANILEHDTPPQNVLAITFTNKAADEMKERLSAIVGETIVDRMWISTFHAMCARMLRGCANLIPGYTNNYTIYDTDDMKTIYREILEENHIRIEKNTIYEYQSAISAAKNELITPDNYKKKHDNIGNVMRIYKALQKRLTEANAMDFDDLLLNTYLVLKENPELLQRYQEQFRYISVDEYQDTNHAQYAIVSMLAQKHQNLMVVGDDDQSIYSWRGADIRNILEFEDDYPNPKVIKLEENYRSTSNILNAANKLIKNNQKRKQKTLFTQKPSGKKIIACRVYTEQDEANWICGKIEKYIENTNIKLNDMAILYRTNVQSRVLEEKLASRKIPYRIIGGLRVFDRAVIKDILAYMTVIVNPNDELAVKRIINQPKRGIGKTTIEQLNKEARKNGITFYDELEISVRDSSEEDEQDDKGKEMTNDIADSTDEAEDKSVPSLRPSCRSGIKQFLTLIENARKRTGNLRSIVEWLMNESGIISQYSGSKDPEDVTKVENLKEFLTVLDEFEEHNLYVVENAKQQNNEAPSEGTDGANASAYEQISKFIEWAALRTDADDKENDQNQKDAVSLMTIHAAKGLEFDVVFLTGMEDSIFPNYQALQRLSYDRYALEEERRLAYVAITRAKKQLYLTYTVSRMLYGFAHTNHPSIFIGEIPEEYLKMVFA